MDLKAAGRDIRRLRLSATRLEHGDPGNVRLLLTISDITDIRAGERLNADLLRETGDAAAGIQHRIANSLQIIASLILRSARGVNSEETRVT